MRAWLVVLLPLLSGSPLWLGERPEQPPRRIVTLAPALTELVVALGEGERLVGVSRFDRDAEVATLPRVGGYVDPNVERVVALSPDLVLAERGPLDRRRVDKMAELGVTVLAVQLQSIEDIVEAIRIVGEVLAVPARAAALRQSIDAQRERTRSRAKFLPKRRVLFVYGWKPLVVAGPGSFVHALLKDAGAVNAASSTKGAYVNYSAEAALLAKPDVVVDASMSSSGAEVFRRLPGLEGAKWVQVKSEALMRPGPRLGEALSELFELVHGVSQEQAR